MLSSADSLSMPLFLDQREGESLEEALERSGFDEVASVLNAMQEQDDDLVVIVRELQEERGRDGPFNPLRLEEKIEVIGPAVSLVALQTSIFVQVLDRLGVGWDEMFGRLVAYKAVHGDCNVLRHWKDDPQLGNWCHNQRLVARKGKLSADRITRLRQLGFVWNRFEH